MPSAPPAFPNLLVVIGASAGGLPANREIVGRLPDDFQAVVVVANHRDPKQPGNKLREILNFSTRLTVREPIEGERLLCTTIYVGKPSDSISVEGLDAHLEQIESRFRRGRRIDDLFESAAEQAGPNSVGVLLSGLLSDGVAGLEAIRRAGGKCLVQNPDDAAFEDLPRNALEAICPDFVSSAAGLAERLTELACDRRCQDGRKGADS